MNAVDVTSLLSQMRAMAAQAQGPGSAPPTGGEPVDFAGLLKGALDAAAEVQGQARGLAEAFERGDPDVSLAQVAIAREKATVSFQAVLQVRNRLISAYQDVMNMPI